MTRQSVILPAGKRQLKKKRQLHLSPKCWQQGQILKPLLRASEGLILLLCRVSFCPCCSEWQSCGVRRKTPLKETKFDWDMTLGKWESNQQIAVCFMGQRLCWCSWDCPGLSLSPYNRPGPFSSGSHSCFIALTSAKSVSANRPVQTKRELWGEVLLLLFFAFAKPFLTVQLYKHSKSPFSPQKPRASRILFAFPPWGQGFHYTKASLLHSGSLQRSWKGWKMSPASFPCSGELPGSHGAGSGPLCRRSLRSVGNPKGTSCGLFQNKGIHFKTSCGRENTISNQQTVLKQSGCSI